MKNPVFADRLKPYKEGEDKFYTKTMEAKQRTEKREAFDLLSPLTLARQ